MEVKMVKTEAFYDTMKHWWDGQKFEHVSPSMLPENTFVCLKDGVPIYSVCFYNTDSNLCWIGWEIGNPDVEDKSGGLKFLLEEVEKYARYVGYHIIFTTSKHPAVSSKLLERKFVVGDENVNHFLKVL